MQATYEYWDSVVERVGGGMKGVHTISLHEHPIVFRWLLLPETTSGGSSDNEVIKYNDKLKIEYSIENNVAIVENNDYIMKIIRL